MSVAWCIRVHSSAVERRIADPEVAGSIPVAPLSFVFLFLFYTRFLFEVARPSDFGCIAQR